jgi:hypothetical protein
MKNEGNDGHGGMVAHVPAAEGDDPVYDGSESELEIHVLENHTVLFSGKRVQHGEPDDTAGDKHCKCNPCQRSGYK